MLLLQVGHGIPQRTPATVDFPIIHPFDAGGPVIDVVILTAVVVVVVVQTVRPLHGQTGRRSFQYIVHFTTISEGFDTSAQSTSSPAVPNVVVVTVVVQISHRFGVTEGTSAERAPERWRLAT